MSGVGREQIRLSISPNILSTGREEGISIGLERGIERGAYETRLETARSMLSIGLSTDQVQLCTQLPLQTILQLMQEL